VPLATKVRAAVSSFSWRKENVLELAMWSKENTFLIVKTISWKVRKSKHQMDKIKQDHLGKLVFACGLHQERKGTSHRKHIHNEIISTYHEFAMLKSSCVNGRRLNHNSIDVFSHESLMDKHGMECFVLFVVVEYEYSFLKILFL
jgi:hypothetical protein